MLKIFIHGIMIQMNTLILQNLFTLRAKIVGKDFTEFFNNLNSKYTARIALQYYPLDIGFFSSHRDPFDIHQIAIPTVSLFKYGEDFNKGGFYLLDEYKRKNYIDKFLPWRCNTFS